jgi:hypothetical protein
VLRNPMQAIDPLSRQFAYRNWPFIHLDAQLPYQWPDRWPSIFSIASRVAAAAAEISTPKNDGGREAVDCGRMDADGMPIVLTASLAPCTRHFLLVYNCETPRTAWRVCLHWKRE